MIFVTSALRALGVQKTRGGFHTALFSYKKGKPHLEKVQLENVKPLDIPKEVLVVTGLNATDVLWRTVEAPVVRGQNLSATLAFQAEPFIPYPIEEAIIAPFDLKKSGKSGVFSLFSTKKKLLEKHLESYREAGVASEAVSCVQAALISFNTLLKPIEDVRCIVNVGEEETACIFLRKQELLGSHSFSIGENNFAVARWGVELEKAILAFTGKIDSVAEVILTGQIVSDEPLYALLQSACGISLKALVDANLQRFAVPIGLAIAFLPNSCKQANFMTGEYAFARPFKPLKKMMVAYLTLCASLALLLFVGGQFFLSHKEQKLMAKADKMLEGRDLHRFSNVKQLRSVLVSLGRNGGVSNKSAYPLIPQVPRVVDFLAWICTHPCGEKRGAEEDQIRIERLAYQMVSRPDQVKPAGRYQVKVDFEFATASPSTAREFHEQLLKANEMINSKDQLQWNASLNKYRVSFFLKDKTFYY